ncbi:hypothetical protein T492DRAFT_954326 [Pavlovales sp. CCMP2436]|nr:hypothetical protein T492DRAFT_954326 [Pavlovales sp. CCMP2436]
MGFRSRFAVLGAPAVATMTDLPCPLWRAKTGMPVVVDISAVVVALRALDRLACRHAQCGHGSPNCAAVHGGAVDGTREGELRPGVPLDSVRAEQYSNTVQRWNAVAANRTVAGVPREARPSALVPARAAEEGAAGSWRQPWRTWDACRRATVGAELLTHAL